ncbi:hypothetical protein [Streptomyces yaizuensis]|uniref:Uncharacterized protein n=1 Tax=Streptomyces yaizuensis TaxID=2989713 RepID=A0ABQ5P757_9ACTN|nr:hypothetical protein [Streptomyces sp. YSPA8]GLF98399.1 hypothetical protein SYYSPA8_28900 [Streptomyces sp. YSPA8]
MARILATYSWQAYPCHYPRRSPESPRTIVIRFAEDHSPVLRVTFHAGDLADRENSTPNTIWFAGDPRYGGVVSPVGGHFPVRVVPDSPPSPGLPGTPEDDALAERAELVKGRKVRMT